MCFFTDLLNSLTPEVMTQLMPLYSHNTSNLLNDPLRV